MKNFGIHAKVFVVTMALVVAVAAPALAKKAVKKAVLDCPYGQHVSKGACVDNRIPARFVNDSVLLARYYQYIKLIRAIEADHDAARADMTLQETNLSDAEKKRTADENAHASAATLDTDRQLITSLRTAITADQKKMLNDYNEEIHVTNNRHRLIDEGKSITFQPSGENAKPITIDLNTPDPAPCPSPELTDNPDSIPAGVATPGN